MEKFKTYTILLAVLSLILLLIVIFGGKHTVYVCYDGTQQEQASKCPAVPPLVITQKAADAAITSYATSYARSKPSVVATVINVYRVNSSWHSDVTFSNAKTGEFNQVTFNIDGKTSSITCLTGCEYMINSSSDGAGNTPENVVVSN